MDKKITDLIENSENFEEIVKDPELLNYLTININSKICNNETPLNYLISENISENMYNLCIFKHLINLGAKSKKNGLFMEYNGFNSYKESSEFVKLLIESGADINYIDSSGMTPLIYILQNYKYIIPLNYVRTLIENGANLNIKDNYDNTALMYYIRGSHYSTDKYDNVLKIFLEYGADYNYINKDCKTAYNSINKHYYHNLLQYNVRKLRKIKNNLPVLETRLVKEILLDRLFDKIQKKHRGCDCNIHNIILDYINDIYNNYHHL